MEMLVNCIVILLGIENDLYELSKGGKEIMRYVIVSIISGFIFGIFDIIINVNPAAVKLLEIYKPISRKSVNPITALIIDLFYGFAMAGIFLVIYTGLPGGTGLIKGMVFGLIIWSFRVVMSLLSSWMALNIPVKTLLYLLITGLVEMLILGLFYGLTLKPLS